MATFEARIAALTRRFDSLEKAIAEVSGMIAHGNAKNTAIGGVSASRTKEPHASFDPQERDTPRVTELKEWAKKKGLTSTRFIWVPSEYYSQPLQWRRDVLQAPTIYHLCKTIVLENTHYAPPDDSKGKPNNKYYSQFYMVVFPYTERYDSEKLMRFVKDQPGNEKMGKKKFNFRMADEKVQEAMTGFSAGSVAPFGALEQENLPVILSDVIGNLSPATFFVGAGHIDCKAELDYAEFVSIMELLVGPITVPLTEEELATKLD